MIKHVLLFRRVFAISLQRQLAHRVNLAFDAMMTAVGLASGLLALIAVFSRVETLAGWSLGSTIILLGTYQFISGMIAAFVTPNLAFFQPKVTNGEIDEVLLKPVSSLFLVSLGTCYPWALVQSVLGLATVAVGIAIGDVPFTAAGFLAYIVLLFVGLLVGWASRVLLACAAFWAPGAEPSIIYDAFWELGRYPLSIYHSIVQRLLTFVIPVAFISTFPAQALVSGLPLTLFVGSIAAAVLFTLLAAGTWRRALRRYTSATS